MKVSGTVTVLSVLSLLALQSVATAQGTFDRSKPPELGPPPKVSLPPIITRQLPNGLKLMIVEQHELPLADFVLLVGSGSTADPVNKPGIANLVSAMLREGTTDRLSRNSALAGEQLGIEHTIASHSHGAARQRTCPVR